MLPSHPQHAVLLRQYLFALFAAMMAVLSWPEVAVAESANLKRQAYLQMDKALKQGRDQIYLSQRESLRDYPLWPYLEYQYLKNQIDSVSPAEIQQFVTQYRDSPPGELLRQKWLHRLANQQAWSDFENYYRESTDTALLCYHLQAQLNLNRPIAGEDFYTLWQSTRDLPDKACRPLFTAFQRDRMFSQQQIWQKVEASIMQGDTTPDDVILSQMDEAKQSWVKEWQKNRQSPQAAVDQWSGGADSEKTRFFLRAALSQMAKKNLEDAISLWQKVKGNFDFSPSEQAALESQLGLRLAYRRDPRALDILAEIPRVYRDEEIKRWRIRAAIWQQAWPSVLVGIEELSSKLERENEWCYWRGRALKATGEEELAKAVWQYCAKTSDFYGFLSAEQVNLPYPFEQARRSLDDLESANTQNIESLPLVARMAEFRALGLDSSARREWLYMTRYADKQQVAETALWAYRQGRYHEGIVAATKAGLNNALQVLFPLAHRNKVVQESQRRQLETAWVYGLMRQESLFAEDVASHVGAMGLMQLMPATAKETAKRIGSPLNHPSEVLKPEKNIELGTAYLASMQSRHHGSQVLATAAYNAGSGRVKQWLPKGGRMAADIWIANIPFTETRQYVQRVMAYTLVYQWLLKDSPVTPLKQRLEPIH